MIAGIILAAGESRRMGQLKPILKIGDKTFLQHIHGQLSEAGVEPIIIVLGFKPEEIKNQCGVNAEFILNHHYKRGQFSSLQTGVLALPPQCKGAIVCLGDQPQIQAEWVHTLVKTYNKTGKDIIIPVFNERSGHPVFYSGNVLKEIPKMSPNQTARELRGLFSSSVYRVPIQSDGILYDADTPRELEDIESRYMQNPDVP